MGNLILYTWWWWGGYQEGFPESSTWAKNLLQDISGTLQASQNGSPCIPAGPWKLDRASPWGPWQKSGLGAGHTTWQWRGREVPRGEAWALCPSVLPDPTHPLARPASTVCEIPVARPPMDGGGGAGPHDLTVMVSCNPASRRRKQYWKVPQRSQMPA